MENNEEQHLEREDKHLITDNDTQINDSSETEEIPASDPKEPAEDLTGEQLSENENTGSEDGATIEEPSLEAADTPSQEVTLETLKESFDGFKAEFIDLFDKKFSYDTFKEEQIRNLHTELQAYKNDFLAQVTDPLTKGLMQVHLDARKSLEFFQSVPDENISREKVANLFEGLMEDILSVLEQFGIDSFREDDSKYNPRLQRIVKTVLTSDPEQVGLVAKSVQPGFKRGEFIVQKEMVRVYAPDKSEKPKSESEAPPDEPEKNNNENITEGEKDGSE